MKETYTGQIKNLRDSIAQAEEWINMPNKLTPQQIKTFRRHQKRWAALLEKLLKTKHEH
jgi:hypothetical protein